MFRNNHVLISVIQGYLFYTKVMVIFTSSNWHIFTTCSLMFILVSDLRFATGVTIPAGAVLVVPVQLVQKDGFNWGKDASAFNPYRFLSNITKESGTSPPIHSWQVLYLRRNLKICNLILF